MLMMNWRNLGWRAACCLSLLAKGLLNVFKAKVPNFNNGNTIITRFLVFFRDLILQFSLAFITRAQIDLCLWSSYRTVGYVIENFLAKTIKWLLMLLLRNSKFRGEGGSHFWIIIYFFRSMRNYYYFLFKKKSCALALTTFFIIFFVLRKNGRAFSKDRHNF